MSDLEIAGMTWHAYEDGCVLVGAPSEFDTEGNWSNSQVILSPVSVARLVAWLAPLAKAGLPPQASVPRRAGVMRARD